MPANRRRRRLASRREYAERIRDSRRDELCILDRSEADEHHAVPEVSEKPSRDLNREPRLAHPASPGQRDQPHIGTSEQLRNFTNLAPATDERRRLRR